MTIIRQWRNIKMLRRAGRGHDPAGVDATTHGQLAVQCRACPLPGINLPDDWDKAAPEFRYVSSLIPGRKAHLSLFRLDFYMFSLLLWTQTSDRKVDTSRQHMKMFVCHPGGPTSSSTRDIWITLNASHIKKRYAIH